jgi:hypothetical protein
MLILLHILISLSSKIQILLLCGAFIPQVFIFAPCARERGVLFGCAAFVVAAFPEGKITNKFKN